MYVLNLKTDSWQELDSVVTNKDGNVSFNMFGRKIVANLLKEFIIGDCRYRYWVTDDYEIEDDVCKFLVVESVQHWNMMVQCGRFLVDVEKISLKNQHEWKMCGQSDWDKKPFKN